MSILAREMGYTRVEFMRVLPSALRNYDFSMEGDVIDVQVGGQPLTITLGTQQVRRIALLAIPFIPVTFDHGAVDATAFKTFLTQFDLYYRKGGG